VGKLKKRGSFVALIGSKRIFSLLILLTLFLMIVYPAFADLGTPVYSSWTTNPPTIDGVISGGEWTDAAVRDFTLDMRDRTWGFSYENLSARFYVKNDENNIYAAVQIFNEDYDANSAFGDKYDGLGLLFEDNHDHVLVDGDNGEGCELNETSIYYANNDLYYSSSSPEICFGGTGHSWYADTQVGKNNDGAMSWSHNNPIEEQSGTYTFEMRIPLMGSDGDAYDLYITSLPRTLGFKIWFFEMDEVIDGVYPDAPAVGKNDEEIENGGTFGNLVLAAPPPPAVGGRAAPIVIPINEPNLLIPLIWFVSAIMFPIALAVVFLKFKKKKL
jgi:hypothetical protein